MNASNRRGQRRPVGGAVAHHALVANSNGVFTLHGAKVAEALTSTADLMDLLDSVRTGGRLSPLPGSSPQIWLVGESVCSAIGWALDYTDDAVVDALYAAEDAAGEDVDVRDAEVRVRAKAMLSEGIAEQLRSAGCGDRGWTFGSGDEFRGGPLVPLRWQDPVKRGGRWFRVNVLVEPYMWTLTDRGDFGILGSEDGGTMPPEDERGTTAELARRLRWSIETFKLLPSATSATTGAALLDAIFKERKKSGKGAVVTAPCPMPSGIDPLLRVEREVLWSRRPDPEREVRDARWLVTVDQRASYLAAAGSQELGWGTPSHLDQAGAEEALTTPKSVPFGLWEVVLPAGAEIGCDEQLPLPLPVMEWESAVQTWVTTESLLTLSDSIASGGAGVDLVDLDVRQAWVYPEKGRILEAWASILRKARAEAIERGDDAAKSIVNSMYKGYIGRISKPQYWRSEYKAHHLQPVWRFTIIASARRRGRRHAAKIAAETGLWPIASNTDSWTYLCETQEQIDALVDTTGNLGRLALEKCVEITDEMRTFLVEEKHAGRRIEGLFAMATESASA